MQLIQVQELNQYLKGLIPAIPKYFKYLIKFNNIDVQITRITIHVNFQMIYPLLDVSDQKPK